MCHSWRQLQVLLASADYYELDFTLRSYRNYEGLCTDQACLNGCPSFCDYNFFVCDRPASTPIDYTNAFARGGCEAEGLLVNANDVGQEGRVSFAITFATDMLVCNK